MGRYFGTDGVRGIANDTLTLEMAFNIGRFLGNYAKEKLNKKIVIGKDTRLSSSMFENMISTGICASGSDVYQIGYCSTPALAYVGEHDDFSFAIMISASHNPYYDNGIKVFSNDGTKISEDLEALIESYMDNPKGIDYAVNENIGKIINYQEGLDHYRCWLKGLYSNRLDNYSVLLDCANGSNSFIAYQLLLDLGCKVSVINDKPNGININNNCGSTHIESLQKEIVKGNYDIGFAFDGDADRVIAVDPKGNALNGDCILFVLSKYLKQIGKLNNDTLVVTGYSNLGLHKALNKYGIKTDIVDNGDKYVLESMLKNNYGLGGEQSGHIIIKKDCNFGDGLKSALCILETMSYYNTSIDELVKELIIYPQLLVNVKVKDKNIVMNDIDILNEIKKIENELNDNGKILVRKSGTEPIVRVMVEAIDNETCKKNVDRVVHMIESKDYVM